MIWQYALEETTPLVEVAYDHKKQPFKVSGPSSVCGPPKIVQGVEAVQLDLIKPGVGTSIHYIRPHEDILCKSTLDDVDIKASVARGEYQAIQRLGIQADSAATKIYFCNYPAGITLEM